MLVTADELKNYLRIDTDEDDDFLEYLISDSQKRCLDVLRKEDLDDVDDTSKLRLGILYSSAYLYEHREDADHNKLDLTLRALFFADRGVAF